MSIFNPQAPSLTSPPDFYPEWEAVPTDEPKLALPLETVKNFLNIPLEDTFFDAEKTSMLTVAQRAIEQYCQMSLLTTTWIGSFPAFYDRINILKRPFNSISKVEYVDPATGVVTTLPTTIYGVEKGRQKTGALVRGDGQSWPATAKRWDAVRVTVSAGWEQAKLPEDIGHAVLLTIAAIETQRGDGGSSGQAMRSVYAMKNIQGAMIIPTEARALLNPYTYRAVTLA